MLNPACRGSPSGSPTPCRLLSWCIQDLAARAVVDLRHRRRWFHCHRRWLATGYPGEASRSCSADHHCSAVDSLWAACCCQVCLRLPIPCCRSGHRDDALRALSPGQFWTDRQLPDRASPGHQCPGLPWIGHQCPGPVLDRSPLSWSVLDWSPVPWLLD